jgi:3'-5' exoribonuclease
MNKKIFIKDITADHPIINDYFVVAKKGTYTTKTNSKYMSISLRDNTGVMEGKVWERVDELNSLFDKNDIVFVKARARLYQEKLQLLLSKSVSSFRPVRPTTRPFRKSISELLVN